MIITVTGRFASGKDSVCKLLNEKGNYSIIDADKLGHECLTDPEIFNQINRAFPSAIKEGLVDRKYLGRLIFPNRVHQLNKIVHPLLISKIKKQLSADCIINAALLKELKLVVTSDVIIYVDSSYDNCMNRRYLHQKKIKKILAIQQTPMWFRKQADIIISNNGKLRDLEEEVAKKCQTLT
jgi:dephospho-CoA kinase